MSDIYVPIDFSDIKNKIPPGEDIIYSTLCKGYTSMYIGTKIKKWNWISHVLMTPNGVAYTFPNTTNRKAPPLQIYSTWDEILAIVSMGKFVAGFSLSFTTSFKLVREENFETKEKFNERSKEFIAKFRPLLIKKKDQWLELNRNNPEIQKRTIKTVEKALAKMKAWENKRIAKEVKKI